MRICLSLASDGTVVPYDHINNLIGVFHRWAGRDNDLHDRLSLYSLGWLGGGEGAGGGLKFPSGATWPLSFHDEDLARDLAEAILENPALPHGLSVQKMQLNRGPDGLGTRHRFRAQSPVLVRKPVGSGRPPDHLHFEAEEADRHLTRTLRLKLEEAGIEADAEAKFEPSPGARTKLVSIGDQKYRANFCPVVVSGPEKALQLAWDAGVGALTGCGFGALQE